MPEKPRDVRCAVCGAALEEKTITYTQTLDDIVFLVTDVPADVCPQCGEQYLAPATVDALQEVLAKRSAETRQVPVYHFPRAG